MGIREEKRQETLRRITQGAMALFTRHGYGATTLDAIAAAAGISRRTFFHYFKSKEDILLSQQAGVAEHLVATMDAQPLAATPMQTLYAAMRQAAASYPLDELIAIDRVMMSIEAVRSRKQANYIRDEHILLEALRHRWPESDDATLRITALLGIGLTRLSLETWRADGGTRPLVHYLDQAYASLEAEFKKH